MSGREWLNDAAKSAVAAMLYHTGVLRLWLIAAMRRKAVVLMYHRVLTKEEQRRTGSHPALIVDRETFARQMAVLKRYFSVLSVEEFAACIERRVPFPMASCLITFDDGWRDSFTNALPILRAHSLPALVFLPVNYVGQRRVFWQEALTHLLLRIAAEVRQDPRFRIKCQEVLAQVGLEHVLDLPADETRLQIMEIVGAHKALSRQSIEILVRKLGELLGIEIGELAAIDGFMDWKEVAAMSADGVSFGGHGAEHLLLTQVSWEEAELEIRRSKEVLDSQLHEAIPTFSYPNGYLTSATARRVQEAGYRLGFITRRGLVRCTDDPFTIRRLNIHEGGTRTTPLFLARVLGLW